MKNKLLIFGAVLSLAAVPVAAFTSSPALQKTAYADSIDQVRQGLNEAGGDNNTIEVRDVVRNVVNTLLFIVGALSVMMIIYSGVLYVLSSGDSGRVSKAKSTLTYSVVGLIVAILSYAIVNFVINVF
ncbi:MAG: hypothetical protein Q4A27_01500 [bacterium]|nr:hypothetical protein [bacterium]